METKQGLKVLNSALAVAFALSLVNFVDPGISGNFMAEDERSNAECSFVSEGERSQISVERCCVEAEKMMSCRETDNGTFCSTGEQGYVLNQEAAEYCRSKGVNIE